MLFAEYSSESFESGQEEVCVCVPMCRAVQCLLSKYCLFLAYMPGSSGIQGGVRTYLLCVTNTYHLPYFLVKVSMNKTIIKLLPISQEVIFYTQTSLQPALKIK